MMEKVWEKKNEMHKQLQSWSAMKNKSETKLTATNMEKK